MTTESAAPAAEADPFLEKGRLLFAGPADFFYASTDAFRLPPMKGIEIAFAGRSNVGKSSLVNAVTGRNTLARTSRTPGRTQQLNFFHVGDDLTMVDMPGYGYAAVGKEKVGAWTRLIHDYLRGRSNLARVFLLIDARHGIKGTDTPVFDTLDNAAVSYQVVLTKADALSAPQLAARIAETQKAIAKKAAAFPDIIATSSKGGMGIEALRGAVAKLLSERTGA